MANEIFIKIARSIGLITAIEPTFFIVGAQKAGTSYLFNFLFQQAAFSSPSKKELDFFSIFYGSDIWDIYSINEKLEN